MLIHALNKGKSLYDLVPEKDDNTKVYHIDLDSKYTSTTGNSLSEGIELLKWLRVKGINNHVVLTSFMPIIYWLKKDPKNAIVGSKGITFVQLPNEKLVNNEYVFKKDEKGNKITPELASPDELKAIFRLDIDIVNIRHESANEWGLYRMSLVHNNVDNSHQVYMPPTNLVSKQIEFSHNNSKINITQSDLVKSKKLLNEIRSKKGKNILFIDDMAYKGWFDLLNNIFFDKNERNKIIAIAPTVKDDLGSINNQIRIAQGKFRGRIDLLLIDFKLFEREKTIFDYTKLVSHEILQELKKTIPQLKVVFFTASNRLNYLNKLISNPKLIPNAIYTKEGIDLFLSGEETIKNYIDFLEICKHLLGSQKKLKSTTLVNVISENEKELLIENLTEELSKDIKEVKISGFKNEKIILDTNFFLNCSKFQIIKCFLKYYKDNIIIHISIYEELKRFQDQDTVNGIKSDFFIKILDELEYKYDSFNVDTYNPLRKGEDEADRYIANLSDTLVSKSNQIYFVNNDKKKGGPINLFRRDYNTNKNVKFYNVNNFENLIQFV